MTKEELEDRNCQWLTDIGFTSIQRITNWLLFFNRLVCCKSIGEFYYRKSNTDIVDLPQQIIPGFENEYKSLVSLLLGSIYIHVVSKPTFPHLQSLVEFTTDDKILLDTSQRLGELEN